MPLQSPVLQHLAITPPYSNPALSTTPIISSGAHPLNPPSPNSNQTLPVSNQPTHDAPVSGSVHLAAALESVKRKLSVSIAMVADSITDEEFKAACSAFEENTRAFETVAKSVFRCAATEARISRLQNHNMAVDSVPDLINVEIDTTSLSVIPSHVKNDSIAQPQAAPAEQLVHTPDTEFENVQHRSAAKDLEKVDAEKIVLPNKTQVVEKDLSQQSAFSVYSYSST